MAEKGHLVDQRGCFVLFLPSVEASKELSNEEGK